MSLTVDIHKRYESFELNISFEAEHETLGFLGASGCGKSLTLRSIAGIETPDEGKIVVNGKVYFDKAAGKKAAVNQERSSLPKLSALPKPERRGEYRCWHPERRTQAKRGRAHCPTASTLWT